MWSQHCTLSIQLELGPQSEYYLLYFIQSTKWVQYFVPIQPLYENGRFLNDMVFRYAIEVWSLYTWWHPETYHQLFSHTANRKNKYEVYIVVNQRNESFSFLDQPVHCVYLGTTERRVLDSFYKKYDFKYLGDLLKCEEKWSSDWHSPFFLVHAENYYNL